MSPLHPNHIYAKRPDKGARRERRETTRMRWLLILLLLITPTWAETAEDPTGTFQIHVPQGWAAGREGRALKLSNQTMVIQALVTQRKTSADLVRSTVAAEGNKVLSQNDLPMAGGGEAQFIEVQSKEGLARGYFIFGTHSGLNFLVVGNGPADQYQALVKAGQAVLGSMSLL